jgi:hypothetical protein
MAWFSLALRAKDLRRCRVRQHHPPVIRLGLLEDADAGVLLERGKLALWRTARGCEHRDVGGKTEMVEDATDDGRRGDRSDDTHAATTPGARAEERVDTVHSA